MRIWLDPGKLAARQLTAADVVAALQEQNVEIPAGQLGRPPSDQKQNFQVTLRVVGRLSEPKEFENIILKNTANGIVQIKDVGRAEIGAESYDITSLMGTGQSGLVEPNGRGKVIINSWMLVRKTLTAAFYLIVM